MENAFECGLALGQIVRSKAGRDKGAYMLVVAIENASYVFLADGDTRTAQNPKRKKTKHIAKTNQVIDGIENLLAKGDADSRIRKILYSYNKPGERKGNN